MNELFMRVIVMRMQTRVRPNILVTGTPGTGKSTLAGQIAERCDLKHVDVNEIAKEKNLYTEYDENYACHVLDEEKVLDEIEDQLDAGGNVVDYHGADFFPERWFDLVVVLRTDNTVLYDRLIDRGYPAKKVQENVQCEIFGTLAEEAREAYSDNVVREMTSNSPDDLERNVDEVVAWVGQFDSGQGEGTEAMVQ